MDELDRVQKVLVGTFVVAAFAAVLMLSILPMVFPWMKWIFLGAGSLMGLLVIATSLVLLASLFPADTDDLWDTSYFQYLRRLLGNTFGGDSKPYLISTCQAVLLSFRVLLFWVFTVAVLSFDVWHSWKIGLGGFEASVLYESPSNYVGNAVVTLFFCGVALNLLLFTASRFLIDPFFDESRDGKRKRIKTNNLLMLFYVFVGALTLIGAPIVSFGFIPVLTWGGGSIITGACAVFIIYLFIQGLSALTRLIRFNIREKTVPGKLLADYFQTLHTKLCPMILQKEVQQKKLP